MNGVVRIMNSQGDATLTWDSDTAKQDEKVLSPEFVKSEFDRLVNGGHLAFVEHEVGGHKEGEQIRSFDPEKHEKVIITPPMMGG